MGSRFCTFSVAVQKGGPGNCTVGAVVDGGGGSSSFTETVWPSLQVRPAFCQPNPPADARASAKGNLAPSITSTSPLVFKGST